MSSSPLMQIVQAGTSDRVMPVVCSDACSACHSDKAWLAIEVRRVCALLVSHSGLVCAEKSEIAPLMDQCVRK